MLDSLDNIFVYFFPTIFYMCTYVFTRDKMIDIRMVLAIFLPQPLDLGKRCSGEGAGPWHPVSGGEGRSSLEDGQGAHWRLCGGLLLLPFAHSTVTHSAHILWWCWPHTISPYPILGWSQISQRSPYPDQGDWSKDRHTTKPGRSLLSPTLSIMWHQNWPWPSPPTKCGRAAETHAELRDGDQTLTASLGPRYQPRLKPAGSVLDSSFTWAQTFPFLFPH